MQHLDVAGGTGDIAFAVLDRLRRADEQAAEDRPDRVTPAVGVSCRALMLPRGGGQDRLQMQLGADEQAGSQEFACQGHDCGGPAELMTLHCQEVHAWCCLR